MVAFFTVLSLINLHLLYNFYILIGVYLEDVGHTLRGLFIIDDKQVLRQITMNDLVILMCRNRIFQFRICNNKQYVFLLSLLVGLLMKP
jgi:hypothetical protein